MPISAQEQWSVFDPIGKVAPPSVESDEWSAAIDAFIYARLKKAGLTPAPAVDRRVWIRRAAYDLTGLPPSPEEVEAFLTDARPDGVAMGEVVDRLLASSRYAERWARHWLDVVRYADSDGFAIDEERLWLWRYRDYVIRVLNEDRPFDQFIREQIAGDELDAGDGGKVAVSFYRLGPYEADNMTRQRRRQDYLNEVTSAVGSSFLGLTLECARCHDHKFDPIPQSDYYRLQAFFAPLERTALTVGYLPGEMTPGIRERHDQAVRLRVGKINKLRAVLRKKIADAKDVGVDQISDGELDQAVKAKKAPVTNEDAAKLKALMTAPEHLKPEQRFEARVTGVRNPGKDGKTPETFVLKNGDVFNPGEKVAPGFLSSALVGSEGRANRAEASAATPGGRRKILAEWLTSPDNPITPRVLVNRIWHHHFGTGIVATPNNLGRKGAGPSHPRLLDYLARRLMAGEWRLKPIHRELLLSRAYRTSTRHPEAERCRRTDPENRLLWRSAYRRLESETIRDAVLAVSGRLSFETGGPGFYEALPDGMGRTFPFFTWDPSSEEQRCRRSIYMFQRRNLVHPMMEAFDGADLNVSCEQRRVSVTAPQALSLLNSRFTHENSLYLAKRLRAEGADDAQHVGRLFWLALSRAPSQAEAEACVSFLRRTRKAYAVEAKGDHALSALRDLSLAIINMNEFLYLD